MSGAVGAQREQSMESSAVTFMQQQHAATLKALHDEIHTLQTRCTDLNFQLTMNGINVEEGASVDGRLTDMHQQLTASQSQQKALQAQLEEQTRTMERLQQEMRAQRKQQLDQRRSQEHALSALQAEAEAKANNIAYLTSQLHSMKMRPQQAAGGGGGEETQGGTTANTPSHPYHTPHLPTAPTQQREVSSGSARRYHRTVSNPRSGVRRVGTLRAGGSAWGGNSVHPDISPFVAATPHLHITSAGKKPSAPLAPLPPIAGSRGSSSTSGREVTRLVIAASAGNPLTRASVPEMATLAVDQIHGSALPTSTTTTTTTQHHH